MEPKKTDNPSADRRREVHKICLCKIPVFCFGKHGSLEIVVPPLIIQGIIFLPQIFISCFFITESPPEGTLKYVPAKTSSYKKSFTPNFQKPEGTGGREIQCSGQNLLLPTRDHLETDVCSVFLAKHLFNFQF